MRIVEIENRWRLSIGSLARDLAAQGLSCKDSAKALGIGYEAFRQHPEVRTVLFDRSHRRTEVSREHRAEFWSVLLGLADKGLNRTECAKALGYHPARFCKMLAESPERDPFEPYCVASKYLKDTGQTIGDAAREFSAAGMSISEAARRIGYGSKALDSFRNALNSRGIKVEFSPGRTRGKKRAATDVRVTQGDMRRIPLKSSWREGTDRRYANERV